MKPYGFVYETTNKLNGMKYIGKCVYERQNDWKKYLGSGTYLKRAIRKYGPENFVKTILEEAYSEKDLESLEELYIKRFDAVSSPLYYNPKYTSIGGDVFTDNPRKEEIRQMKVRQMTGKNNHQYGKPKTKKMIDAVKESNSRKVNIEGIEYESQSKAAKVLGLAVSVLNYRLDSTSFPTYKRLVPKNIVHKRKKI